MPSARASSWRLRTRTLTFGAVPKVMGIVNMTPDSFSDGGRFGDADDAVNHALQLVAGGADILDIGGESTRPNAPAVSADEEASRVLPIIEALRTRTVTPISVDTSKADVAEAALEAGAEILNDVTGFTDPAMTELAIRTGAGLCVMHMRGNPRTMQDNPVYDDVVGDVTEFLRNRRDALVAAGVEVDRVALDPGVGFGKTVDHNLELLRRADELHTLGAPLLYGHSRKSFMGKVLGDVHIGRDHATVGTSLALAQRGVQILRVHDAENRASACVVAAASGGLT